MDGYQLPQEMKKCGRETILDGLNEVMSKHHFQDQGVSFSQFQRYLQKPYNPNLRDIYYVLTLASEVGVTQEDISTLCAAAQISPIQPDPLDTVLCGLMTKMASGSLTPLDTALFQSEVSWLTANNSNKIAIADFLNQVESDPDEDCDSILNNLDPNGVVAFEEIITAAVPSWAPTPLGYERFDRDLHRLDHIQIYRCSIASSGS